MKRKAILFLAVVMILFSVSLVNSSGWQLKDMGVGIYDDAAYDKELRIVEKRNTWSMQELQSRSALIGRGKVFGAWLVGPPVNTYLNKNGVAEYGYKYRLTDPKGQSIVAGPHGFYMPGFTTTGINVGVVGNWRIDYMLWHRSTEQVTPIGSIEFKITDGATAKPVQTGWQLKDMGVGIYDDAAYDKELRIVEKRNTWSIQELQSRGALIGRGKVFGVWLVGPPVSSYLNKHGQAEYAYKYRLTDPKGNSSVFGPHGFYSPGFTTIFINTWIAGNWKVEFTIWQRSTQQDTPIGTIDFKITD
ncbi:MAG: hypothetical protein FD159_220 [Syntrophaceae bacterium]|nr:MAG: hypothetical protein FD159_220 [Syntrophaceae bacterium]